jgi:transcription termination/antitermination protein NusG
MTHWYVVATNPNCEKKAVNELRRAGLRVYLPQKTTERVHRRTKAVLVKHRPLMVGYLFVRFPGEMLDRRGVPPFGIARACQGVKEFLRAINEQDEWEPFPIPEKMVAMIMRRQRGREFGNPIPPKPVIPIEQESVAQRRARLAAYKAGREMKVAEGPFSGFDAIIQQLLDNGSVIAEISIFGRPNRVTFDNPEHYLRALDAPREAA